MLTTPDSPILCYVTSRKALGLEPNPIEQLLAIIRRAIEAGVDWIQIREKDLPGRELIYLVREAVAAATGTRTKILVNDRLDVAIAVHAAGVHLGAASLPVRAVAGWRESHAAASTLNFLIGASCHSLEQAQSAEQDGADYVIFGPVFETPSKASFGPPQGIERLRNVCAETKIPVLAIGGVNAANASDCIRAGAAGIAAIRMFQEARNSFHNPGAPPGSSRDENDLRSVIKRLKSLKRT
ncbi:MAG: thiamine phosphate synthase [Candidatus Acidiferrales bacterium]